MLSLADLAARIFSRVDEYSRTLGRTVDEQVGKIAQNKSKETEAETERLKQATQLDDREREDRSRKTQQKLTEWDATGKSVRDVMAQIKTLERSGATPTGPHNPSR